MRVAQAVDLSQIYRALGRLKNICFATFDADKMEPTQQIWISQALDIMIFKTEEKCVLWDIHNKSSESKELITGSSELTTLNSEALAKVAKTMEAPWGLLPFDDMSQVPPDATWQHVAAENIETTIPHTRVYDLMWTEKTLAGFVAHNKWRGYIDIDTKLPRRVEQWQKRSGEEYELTTVIKVTYPTAAEIQAVVNDMGF